MSVVNDGDMAGVMLRLLFSPLFTSLLFTSLHFSSLHFSPLLFPYLLYSSPLSSPLTLT